MCSLMMSLCSYLIVVPYSLCKEFLTIAHNKAGHQGTDRTLSQLQQIVYWVGMSRDVTYATALTVSDASI